jgi:prophage maintenance system killer protein
MSDIIIFTNPDNSTSVEVRMDHETVWLSLNQIASLFDRDKSVISRHLKNIFNDGELNRPSVVAFFATTAADGKTYDTEHFNLDAILSVGYRVNSKRGTQFRQWATQHLRDHLIQGFTVNEKRLREHNDGVLRLKRAVEMLQGLKSSNTLTTSEINGILEIISRYTSALNILGAYDRGEWTNESLNSNVTFTVGPEEARTVIRELRKTLKATSAFGEETGDDFTLILKTVAETRNGEFILNSIEEQAAHLMYSVIRNRPFKDGNKRIGAFLFVWFLERNRYRLDAEGMPKINANGLAALALLVAQSEQKDKEEIIKLIIHLVRAA